MPELDALGDESVEALGNAFASGVKQLFGYRTFLGLAGQAFQITGGWIDSLLYRDAGERGLRGAFGSVLQGAVSVVQFFVLRAVFGGGGALTAILVLWAGSLRYADWLAAMNRRRHEKTKGYLFSRFIGWPRFVSSARPNCYWLQGFLVVGVGVLLFILDHTAGAMMVVAGVCALGRLWVMGQLRREDAMDALDAEWLAGYRSKAKAEAGGEENAEQDVNTARRISTADFIHHYV